MIKTTYSVSDGVAVIELNDPGLSIERELQQLLFQGEDAKEGLAANLEKRPPQFKGR